MQRPDPEHVQFALATLKAAAEVDGSEVIYLHTDGTKPSFGVLLRGESKRIAEDALEASGRNPYDHSHIDGDD